MVILSYTELRDDSTWSQLWTSSGSVGQWVWFSSYLFSRRWIQGRPFIVFV